MMKTNYVFVIPVSCIPLKLLFVALTICLSAGIVLSKEGEITCDVPSVEELRSTELTCHFPEDVSLTRKDVSVYLYRENNSPVSVLNCWWPLQGNINCAIALGYTFTGTVSHVLTIHIPRVTVNQTGTYSCQLTGYTRSQLETCDFKILSVSDKITCDVPSVKALTTTTLTCHFPEDINQSRKDFTVYLYKESEYSDYILDCWWLGGHLDCFVDPGYQQTKSISRQLTVTIPRAAASQTGTYACHVAGYSVGQVSTCDFNIASGTKTICDAPSVREGSSAWLSCYFSENVGGSKKDFAVYHVSSQGSKEMILTCTWSQDSLTCHTAPDYQFDKRVTNTATVMIPKVSASHIGNYSCQLAGAEPRDYEDCVFSLDQGQVTSCNIPPVKLMEPATITFNFNVDLNKTKTNFNIVHISDQNQAGVDVLECVWQHDELVCDVTSGLKFSLPVTDRLVITIPQTKDSHVGKYLCQLQTASKSATHCELVIVPDAESTSKVSVVVWILITLTILVLMILGVLLYHRVLIARIEKVLSTSKEAQLMLPIQATDQTTERLQESLSASIRTMYPDILTACYFVPSLYINRNTYTKVEVAGEKVVVMEAAPDDILRHDQAIQHVLKCLRYLADRDKAAMFVLSQFTYDDYLASVDEEFSQHKLPMPSDLTRRDTRYENFDVLIVHRHYGVVVVVVKASVCTVDMGVEIRDNERVVQDLQEAVEQLDGAERMLKHLMSDLKPGTMICKTLMLPNLSLTSLREILEKHKDVAKALRKSTGLTEMLDISGECLCADQLHSDNMVDQLNVWIQNNPSGPQVDHNINDDSYLKIVSRFCGLATRPSLTLPNGRRLTCTPSSHEHAVSLTGELFNGAIIHSQHHQLLTEAPPRVFMFGPPGSGKTTSLRLIGKKWLSEGHRVCVLSTWRESITASMLLYGMLLKDVSKKKGMLEQTKDMVCPDEINHESSTHETTKKSSKENQSYLKKDAKSKKDVKLIYKEVNLESTDTKKVIKDLLQLSSTDNLFILVDEAGPLNEGESFKVFCDNLWTENQNVHLWAASCLKQMISNKWKVVEYQTTVSCPPSILREKELIKIVDEGNFKIFISWDLNKINFAPTEGLPVRFVYHCGEGHSKGQPFTCSKCSRCVVDLLTSLHINPHSRDTSKDKKTGYTSIDILNKSDGINPDFVTPRLYPSDVLVLYEYDNCKETTLFKTLKDSGFSINMVNEKDFYPVSKDNGHDVLAADRWRFRGFKSKVVVYVEGHVGQFNVPLEWKRLRGVTSCTAQLIWVRDKMPNTSNA